MTDVYTGDPLKTVANLRAEALEHFRVRPMTADECAWRMGRNALSIRPRISELVAAGELTDAGVRRKNASGKDAKVWKLAKEATCSPPF